mmetsp:Transcript_17490/g.24480  ORF Transcript_17490/g.24480 Transcript_17490/m.24480 type:complete len:101 (+) Transcript_17490:324-626(+)
MKTVPEEAVDDAHERTPGHHPQQRDIDVQHFRRRRQKHRANEDRDDSRFVGEVDSMWVEPLSHGHVIVRFSVMCHVQTIVRLKETVKPGVIRSVHRIPVK